ncbi:MAG: M20 family metallo-hydrolase [Flavisolibacter sp.]
MKKEPVLLSKDQLSEKAIGLLKDLIATESFSKEEKNTADIIANFLTDCGVEVNRHLNNIWVKNKYFDESRQTILLNSHHDTVRPNKGYTLNPFSPVEKDGKLFGLGSNDAGGALVSLLVTFLHYYERTDLKYNLVFAATAEEEITGKNGIESLLPLLPPMHSGIVGEPTLMQMAVAERGLIVLDCIAHGIAGHAARSEGENAIYKAMMDIEWIYVYWFDKVSDLLGPVKMSVTSIETDNKTHNIVPSECRFVVDVRVNELYSLEEVIETIKKYVQSEVTPRSTRLKSSGIAMDHPLVKAGTALGRTPYGSPTTSDKALMPFPTLKIGPGDSARSHTADEYIFINEIKEGINLYIKLLDQVL